MKNTSPLFWLILASFLSAVTSASAIIFTNNTAINPLNTNYDGADIVVSNCTVTVDGPHTFASLMVGPGGTLTHSCWPNGLIVGIEFAYNEPHVLNATNPVTLSHTNAYGPVMVKDSTLSITYSNGVDYVETDLPDSTIQIERTETSSIPDGATVLVSYSWNYVTPAGLYLTVTGDVVVASGGSINANGIGYGGASGYRGAGPGSGWSSGGTFFDGSGAGHGGRGGNSSSNAVGGVCYDSLYQPDALGSGGGASYAGNGGNGGGAAQITATGNVDVDGVIAANGADATNSRAGGGAGGSIWISAASVSGAGSISANGGAGAPLHGGGGGGGRITIQCNINEFSGTTTAYGGNGWQTGGAGTVFTQLAGQIGSLVVDNGGRAGTNSTVTLPTLADVTIRGDAGVTVASPFNPSNLTISANSLLTGPAQSSLTLYVAGNLTIQAGGALSLDGLGYAAGLGAGGGHTYFSGAYNYGGGGGHGGYGGAAAVTNATGGSTYDMQTAPTGLGSGGGGTGTGSAYGGPGGGAVQLSVTGHLQVDGRLTANGSNGSGMAGGGGAGGSILIYVRTLAGAGSITANGGNGTSFGGGGGGGRIAIVTSTNLLTGTITAYGGGGANRGGAGTIYLQPGNAPVQLILDNAGQPGAPTPLSSFPLANLIVQNGAVGSISFGVTFSNLWVGSNAWLTAVNPYGSGTGYTINGDATFQAGGGFTVDSCGYPGSQGNGGGNGKSSPNFQYAASGGGHGGTGGSSVSNSVPGGSANDYVSPPLYTGSGGGGYTPYSIGGSGGGFVQMTVNGTLQLDGLITANGGNGSGLGGGGGAGGSVYLTTGTLSGGGTIRANGGNGVNSLGGGGGGGRIAVYFNTNLFAGTVSAYGGGGANYGGAGTIYFRTNATGHAWLVVDNGGHAGADSLVQAPAITDLTLRNSGLIYVAGSMGFGNLVVSSNAWLMVTNLSVSIAANNVTVQAGGGIIADAGGYPANQGTGHGNYYSYSPNYPGSGGGHGGYGANSCSNAAAGGSTFDTITLPAYPGSGGGGYPPYSTGGSGGGLIQLNVSGALQVDGVLSANGGNGSGSGGGGSGGSINLNCYTLSGTGLISANGGNGVDSTGGGGGGGMIAITFTPNPFSTSNLFAGTISAYGGGGANYGGAGTIYIRTNYARSTLIVDNAGHHGTNTPVSYSSSNYGLVLRNGAVATPTASPLYLLSLLISSNAWLVPGNNYPGTVNLTVSGDAVIQAGGGIITDATGSAQNTGTGRGFSYGISPWYPCSGAGHGGYGAFGLSNLVAGGVTFDSTTSPSTIGSGGGGYSTYSIGGAGGGYIRLSVAGALQLDGVVSANGGNGTGSGGGGAGGSVYIYTTKLGAFGGNGSITANGGYGAQAGGGGGGGRIAIYTANNPGYPPLTNSFAGTVSAYGGGGANWGGAGTIYYQTNSQSQYALLFLDNGGHAGTNTSFDFLNMDATIQNGAVGLLPVSGSWSPHNILVRTNGTLAALASSNQRVLNANDVTIENGGAISLDGAGYGPQAGPGSGNKGPLLGGGGHGGYGGGNPPGWGLAYDSIPSPGMAGSGGGSYSGPPYAYGGPGGGALLLNISGTLTVNGRLSANGAKGAFNAGGGAGGSLYLASIYNLTGSGVISANGGPATGAAGGGGGGRVALYCTSNNFTGRLSAAGGGGNYPGGAGTIFTSVAGAGTLRVDNGGLAGTNTPLADAFALPATPFDLNISGAATVVPLTPLPLLSNLNLAAGSTLTMPVAQSNLFIAVLNNANLAGNLTVDDLGFPQTNGPGAGNAISSKGSGGGYGGVGGASATGAPGGTNYGSATQPVDFGSGGGQGAATGAGGSDGGGALRLSVAGALNVDGSISADGNSGWQDDSGGGAGGSVWINAGALSGTGNISAAGGDGAPLGGGGGGGGRIAIYTPTNHFTGATNASGGNGASPGQPGTVFLAGVFPGFQIVSQSPAGVVSNIVSYVDLNFSEALNPASVSTADFTLITPTGAPLTTNLSATVMGLSTVRVGFPVQNVPGDYSIQTATAITNLFGLPLAEAYAGTFTISLPTISGTVTDTNGAPVAGVLLQPDGGLTGATTDANGYYFFGVPPGWSGSVTPALGNFMFVPGSLAYTNVTGSLTNQNYLMVLTIAPSLVSSLNGTNLSASWTGLAGVTYQAWWSTNLVDWQPLGDALAGTNGPMQIALPLDAGPAAFFRVSAGH